MCSVYASSRSMLVVGWAWQCPEARPVEADEESSGDGARDPWKSFVPSCVSRLGRWQPAKDPAWTLEEASTIHLIGRTSIFIYDPCSLSHSRAPIAAGCAASIYEVGSPCSAPPSAFRAGLSSITYTPKLRGCLC